MSKYVFTRKAGESFQFSMKRMQELEPKLMAAYESLQDINVTNARVQDDVKKFCADAWDEMTRRLAFETKQPYDSCSREIARRAPWVYLAFSAQPPQGGFASFDVDLTEAK